MIKYRYHGCEKHLTLIMSTIFFPTFRQSKQRYVSVDINNSSTSRHAFILLISVDECCTTTVINFLDKVKK